MREERSRSGAARSTLGEWPGRRCKMSYARALLEAAGITKPLEHCIRRPLVTLSKVSIT